MINTIISWINQFLGSILFFLPTSPFTDFISEIEEWEWLSWLNWILPIGTFVKILAVWGSCIAVYYLYSLVLRWIRAVS